MSGDTTRRSAFQGAIVPDFAPWKALLQHRQLRKTGSKFIRTNRPSPPTGLARVGADPAACSRSSRIVMAAAQPGNAVVVGRRWIVGNGLPTYCYPRWHRLPRNVVGRQSFADIPRSLHRGTGSARSVVGRQSFADIPASPDIAPGTHARHQLRNKPRTGRPSGSAMARNPPTNNAKPLNELSNSPYFRSTYCLLYLNCV